LLAPVRQELSDIKITFRKYYHSKQLPGMRSGNEQFPALTGIRAVAAFMVFFNHLPIDIKPGFLVGLQLSFYWGVTLFFVLSGLLITYRYYDTIELTWKWFARYFINRFARIYPVYFLVVTIVIIALKNTDPVYLLQNYTLTHNLFFLFPSHGLAIDPSWTLTVEECFYLLAPFIFLLCRKTNFWVPLLITIILFIVILVTYNPGIGFEEKLFAVTWASFFGHCIEFFCGIFLGLVLLRNKGQDKIIPGVKFTTGGIIAIAILIIPLIYVTNIEDASFQHLVMMLVNNLLLPVPIALLYYGLVYEKSICRRILSGRIAQLLGRASYAFYLLHLPLINFIGTRAHFGEQYYNLQVLFVFLLAIVLSVIVYLFFEAPVNRFIRRSVRWRAPIDKDWTPER
jgi:peptidoglycan/LPS O-acetylase OafA/YrhL